MTLSIFDPNSGNFIDFDPADPNCFLDAVSREAVEAEQAAIDAEPATFEPDLEWMSQWAIDDDSDDDSDSDD